MKSPIRQRRFWEISYEDSARSSSGINLKMAKKGEEGDEDGHLAARKGEEIREISVF